MFSSIHQVPEQVSLRLGTLFFRTPCRLISENFFIDQIAGTNGNSSTVSYSSIQTNGTNLSQAEEQARKREIRLMKNREAAKECRNKKKEYIKCLENRVAVLENQNKALIEELKSLKELYTGQKN